MTRSQLAPNNDYDIDFHSHSTNSKIEMAIPMDLMLFSDGSLLYSLSTTIWIGVCVLACLNLLLGFPLSGLIVPGFLVPLSMAHPLTGALIVFEASLTWSVVAGLAWAFPRFALGSKFFGRDRFFAILLASILVRLLVEGVLVEALLAYSQIPALAAELRSNATSFGLVLVPLMANQFWKPGLFRGLGSSALVCLITYGIISLILIPWTNFNFAGMALNFQLASQYLPDSPKAYIILMTTVFIASRLNLNYGWDFSGIIFPGLIALSIFDPLTIILTMIETLVIVAIAKSLLQVPQLRSKALEGAYSILFFFNIAFVYKLLLGGFVSHAFAGVIAEDLLGLGYVMSTMFAIKICRQKSYLWSLSSSMGMVATVGLTCGLMLSILLKHLSTPMILADNRPLHILTDYEHKPLANTSEASSIAIKPISIWQLLHERMQENPSWIAPAASNLYQVPAPHELDRFRKQLIQALIRFSKQTEEMGLAELQQWLGDERIQKQWHKLESEATNFGYALDLMRFESDSAHIVLSEVNPSTTSRHWGFYAFRLGPAHDLGIFVSRPFAETRQIEFGLWAYREFQARLIMAATAHPFANDNGSSRIDNWHNHPLQVSLLELGRMQTGITMFEVNSHSQSAGDDQDFHIAINPYLKAEDDRLSDYLEQGLDKYNLKLAYTAIRSPSYSLKKTLALGNLPLYSLSASENLLAHLAPLGRVSSWERIAQSIGVEKRYDLVNSRQVVPGLVFLRNSSESANQSLQGFLSNRDPLALLQAKQVDGGLRLHLVEDLGTGDQYLELSSMQQEIADLIPLTGFESLLRSKYEPGQHSAQSQIEMPRISLQ